MNIVKNKIAPPFKVAEFDIMYSRGMSYTGDLLDLAANYEFVHRAGAFYNYGELKLGQGRENAKKFLEDNPKVMKELDKMIRSKVKEQTA